MYAPLSSRPPSFLPSQTAASGNSEMRSVSVSVLLKVTFRRLGYANDLMRRRASARLFLSFPLRKDKIAFLREVISLPEKVCSEADRGSNDEPVGETRLKNK